MNKNKNLATISKMFHAILFVGLFFFIKNQNGGISWTYIILGLVFLLISLKRIEDVYSCKYNPLSKWRTFLTAVVPSFFIYLGLYLLVQNMCEPMYVSFILAVSTLMAFLLSLIKLNTYKRHNNFRIERALLRKELTKEYQYYYLKNKMMENLTNNKYKPFNIKATSVIFSTVIGIIAASILIDMTGVSEVIFSMVIYSYIIPLLFVILPILALFNLCSLTEISKEYFNRVNQNNKK